MITAYPSDTEAAMRQLFNSLGERERRLYAAAEAIKLGHGGLQYLAAIFDCDPKTVRRGLRELQEDSSLAPGQSRKKGADEKPA
jgi:transposase-like protein